MRLSQEEYEVIYEEISANSARQKALVKKLSQLENKLDAYFHRTQIISPEHSDNLSYDSSIFRIEKKINALENNLCSRHESIMSRLLEHEKSLNILIDRNFKTHRSRTIFFVILMSLGFFLLFSKM